MVYKNMKKTGLFFLLARFLVVIFVVAVFLVFRYTELYTLISLAQFKVHREYIKLFVDTHYLLSFLIFIGSYIVVVALSLPLALLLTLIGGFLFGISMGVPGAVFGGTGGAVISFIVTRYVLYDVVQKKYAAYFKVFNHEMERHGAWYLLGMHLLTVVPFSVINIVAAMTRISLKTFVVVTAVGMLPGAFLYSYLGQELMTIEQVSDIFSPRVLGVLAILSIITIGTFVYRRYTYTKKMSGTK